MKGNERNWKEMEGNARKWQEMKENEREMTRNGSDWWLSG